MQGQSVASAHFLLCRAVFWVSTVVSVMNANSTRNALPLCSQIMVRILGAATHHTSHSNAPSQKKLAICTLLITDRVMRKCVTWDAGDAQGVSPCYDGVS